VEKIAVLLIYKAEEEEKEESVKTKKKATHLHGTLKLKRGQMLLLREKRKEEYARLQVKKLEKRCGGGKRSANSSICC